MKLEFVSVICKNFLTYGDIPFTFTFENGINLIKGANGKGKSSIVNAILFGLFGRISKDVKKQDVINWKNGKNCEISLLMRKNGKFILIHRGIKPNILEVYIDGIQLPSPPDVRDFQKQIETDIIGFDYKSNLIYHNPNNDVSLIDAKKPQKRELIEQLFDLKYFSELDKKVNINIREIDIEKAKIESNIEFCNKTLIKLKDEKNNIVIPDISHYKNKLEIISEEYNDALEESKNLDDINKINLDIEKLNQSLKELSEQKLVNNIDSLNTEKKSVNKRIQNIGNIDEKIKLVKSLLVQQQELGNFTEDSKKSIETKIYDVLEKINNSKIINSGCLTREKSIKNEIKKLQPDNSLKGKSICPTCGSKIDYNEIKSHFDIEIQKLNEELNEIVIIDISEDEKSLTKYKKLLLLVDEKLKLKRKVEIDISSLNSIDKESKEIDESNKRITEIETLLLQENEKIQKITVKIDEVTLELQKSKDQKIDIEGILNNVDILSKKYTQIESEYNLKKQEHDISIKLLHKNCDDIKSLTDELLTYTDVRTQHVEKLEYLKYIKVILKDENVKKYAISNIIPYINKFSNEYLSEVGFNFYVTIDSWLDCIIDGPGRKTCDSNCLSGGEFKSVDLAMKFAIMKTVSMRSENYPDILVLDEILDSSMDNDVLNSMVEIIKVKQKKDNLKVYIISHREELKDIDFDNVYLVEKINEFSKITKEN